MTTFGDGVFGDGTFGGTVVSPIIPPTVRDRWSLFVRNAQREIVAQVDEFDQATFVLRDGGIGTWMADLTNKPDIAEHLNQPRAGIVLQRNDDVVFSGPVWQRNREETVDVSILQPSGRDDNHYLFAALAMPQPGTAAPPYSTNIYDVRSGVRSTIMRQYVDVNIGAAAVGARRLDGLILAADPVLGGTITMRARFQVLGDLLRFVAFNSTPQLRFQLVQSGEDLEFSIASSADRSNEVIFALDLGTLDGFGFDEVGPEGNYYVAGGDGSGTSRTVREGANGDSIIRWGRVERFIDQRDTTDAGELDQAVFFALTEGVEQSRVDLTTAANGVYRWRDHYNLGDTVSVIVDAVRIINVIREIEIKFEGDNVTITPSVGTAVLPSWAGPSRTLNQVKKLARRVLDLARWE